jgi:hypothetical protein
LLDNRSKIEVLKLIFQEFVTLSLKTLKRCENDYPGLWKRVSNQQRGLELFFRFDHFTSLERAELIPSLDHMSKGKIRNLDMSPNKLFIEEAYIDEDFD